MTEVDYQHQTACRTTMVRRDRLYISFAFAVVFFCCLSNCQALARQSDEPEDDYASKIDTFKLARALPFQYGMYQFDGAGNLATRFVQSASIDANIEFFKDASVQDELELTERQKSDLQKLLDEWRKLHEAIEEEMAKRVTPIEVLFAQVAEEDDKALNKLRKVLLPHQFAVINQLQFRCLVRNYGLKPLLANDVVQAAIGISGAEHQRLTKANADLRAEVVKRALDAKRECLRLFLEPLSEDQRKIVTKKWASLFDEKSLRIEQLMIFLDNSSPKWLPKDTPAIEAFIKRPVFIVGMTGNLVLTDQPHASSPEWRIFSELSNNIELRDVLALDQFQANEVFDVLERARKAIAENGKLHLMGQMESNVYSVECEKTDTKATRDLKRALGNQNWTKVEQFCDKINIRCAGPVYDILDGDLSKELGLDEKSKEKIKSSAAAAHKYLTEETRKIEDFALEKLFSVLDESNQRKIKESMGARIKKSPANIELMLMMMMM